MHHYLCLRNLDSQQIIDAIRSLPTTVTSLDLGENNLGTKTGAELAQAFAAIRASVVGFNDVEANNTAELQQLLAALPTNVQSVILADRTINLNEFGIEQLIRQVNEYIVPRQSLLGFEYPTPFMEIDEVRLTKYIHALEQKNTPVALLTCGLLLSGHIETTTDEPRDLNQYMEKRMHDAISFYTKAAQDTQLKPLIDSILWELKTNSEIPSVQKRLASYDVTPAKDDIPSYGNFKTPSVSIPLSNDHRFFAQAYIQNNTQKPIRQEIENKSRNPI